MSAAGHRERDTLPGAQRGDGDTLGDSEAVAYRLLAGLLGMHGVHPLEAKTGRLGGAWCCACSHM